jgi:DNA processing protein
LANVNPKPHAPPTSESERLEWLRLARSENVGPVTFYELLNHFGSVRNALENLNELASRGGKSKPIEILSLKEAEQEYAMHIKRGAHLLTALDANYPRSLASLPDAPPVLSVFGDPAILSKRSLAVVGSRNASLNGKRFAETISRDLGQHGWVIASGLARGIDTHAHKGSLPTGTIAVVAGGVDHIYPPENQVLYEAIKEKGAIISEAPFGCTPKAHFFPRRNRLISGLSTGVIVVEAAYKSGSLITARNALEQGREVFAVPGSPYDPRCRGTNSLIAQGATLIQGVQDVIDGVMHHLPKGTLHEDVVPYEEEPRINNFSEVTDKQRQLVEENLSHTPSGLDELARQCQICTEELLCIILELEMAGRVIRTPGNQIALITS